MHVDRALHIHTHRVAIVVYKLRLHGVCGVPLIHREQPHLAILGPAFIFMTANPESTVCALWVKQYLQVDHTRPHHCRHIMLIYQYIQDWSVRGAIPDDIIRHIIIMLCMHMANSHAHICLWQFLGAVCGSPYNCFHLALVV